METNSSNKLSTLVKKVPSSPREFFAKLYESAEQEDAQIKIDAEETPKLRKLFVPGVKKVGESRPGEKVMLETSSLIWTNYYSPPPPTGRSRHENIELNPPQNCDTSSPSLDPFHRQNSHFGLHENRDLDKDGVIIPTQLHGPIVQHDDFDDKGDGNSGDVSPHPLTPPSYNSTTLSTWRLLQQFATSSQLHLPPAFTNFCEFEICSIFCLVKKILKFPNVLTSF
ncbi:hypothetical protein Fcan01_08787 [Folsomia candida]|uniref:Uncharacterized protein n=1 Tax=Folsomia candida TaxID=158441 RepID=A0A226EDB8_FOLCA|nr:hypothetical protein Fcan01_08787 [Folsomia candida]